ncbi:hypothetical protein [Mycobacterium sp. GA-1999]|uniref:hypothetical protein n=1 Tax=Mycobacterium sp. GA-1999 TaxID=1772275 RepID=UPI000B04047D|nr:hypothetical protein [Mycobacterium sp. GA-1999]
MTSLAASRGTIDRYVVISTGAHAGADLLDYKPYACGVGDSYVAPPALGYRPFEGWLALERLAPAR